MRLCDAVCLLWLTWLALGNADDPKIVCYYRKWAISNVGYERLKISDIDPSLCTHLIYAFVGVTEDGDMRVLHPQFDLPDKGGKAGFQKFNALRKQNEKLKTLVSTGDWIGGSARYSKIAADTSLRSKYVQNVVDFLLRHKFDGFDINWQWPIAYDGSPYDMQNYVILLKELRKSFDEHDLILSIQVEGSERYAEQHYDIPQISKYPHFIQLDIECHQPTDSVTGHGAPLYPAARETSGLERSRNIEASLHYWLNQGVPAEKIIVGTRFHGLSYTLKNSARHGPGSPASGPAEYSLGLGYIGYNEICRLTSRTSWTFVWDAEQRVPYSYAGDQWISYDNVRSLTEKAKYALAVGLGGVMVWSIDMDDHRGECGERCPLLKALNCGLREVGCSSTSRPDVSTTSEADIADLDEDTTPKILCYYRKLAMNNIGYEKMEVSDIDASLCTHLIYAFVGLTEDSQMRVLHPQLDLPDNGGKAGFQKFNALRKTNEGLKTLVSTGDWSGGPTTYSSIASDTNRRSSYVKNVVGFVLLHEFDGLDIYWQWPTVHGGNPNDVQNFVLLLKELRENFDKHNLTLSVQVEGSEQYAQRYYDIPLISKYVHFIVLDVECHKNTDTTIGHSAPLYPAAREISALDRSLNYEASVSYWLKEGVPANKIIMGTLFHGLGYILNKPAEHSPGSLASGPAKYSLGLGSIGYNEICRLTRQGTWTSVWDKEQRVPYSYAGNRWISYDNVRSLIEKAQYAKTMGLGGVMAWSIDLDDHRGDCGERYPLLNALNCGLRETGCSSVSLLDSGMTSEAEIIDSNEAAKRTCARFNLKYIRHSQDCAKFWICQKIGENEFRAEPFSCGDGLHFDTNKIMCKSKNLVQCRHR